MKMKDVLEKTAGFFREKGFSSPRLDAEILLSHALKIERIRLYLDFERPLSEDELNRCRDLVKRRSQGEPVAYITGKKEFFGLLFDVTPTVLIPRPETEHLVEEGIDWARMHARENEALRIVDLGCGSGCIGIALLKNIPHARLLAVDLSAEAVEVAESNAARIGVLDRCEFVMADASDPENVELLLEKAGFAQIDMLLANPPYIDSKDTRVEDGVRRFEPSQALFAGQNGLAALRQWSHVWAPQLAASSICLMEMGTDQAAEMTKHFNSLGIFSRTDIIRDLGGHDRVIKGVRVG